MAVPYSFSAGTLAKSDEVNENFAYCSDSLVPIGGVIPWLKNLVSLESGTPTTSTTASKLIDSAATFTTNGVVAGQTVVANPYTYTNTTAYQNTGDTYDLQYTVTINADSSRGELINSFSSLVQGNYNTFYIKAKFFYNDTTTAEVEASTTTSETKTLTNPNPTKKIYKIEIYTKNSNSGSYTTINDGTFTILAQTTSVVSVDSETQLTLASDIFGSTLRTYNVYSTYSQSENWVECNGQTLSDAESVFNGVVIPNLNNSIYLKGSTTSSTASTFGGTGTTYANYSVVYLMRVK